MLFYISYSYYLDNWFVNYIDWLYKLILLSYSTLFDRVLSTCYPLVSYFSYVFLLFIDMYFLFFCYLPIYLFILAADGLDIEPNLEILSLADIYLGSFYTLGD